MIAVLITAYALWWLAILVVAHFGLLFLGWFLFGPSVSFALWCAVGLLSFVTALREWACRFGRAHRLLWTVKRGETR